MAKRLTAPAMPVLQSVEEFEAKAVELGNTMREIGRINSNAADRLAAVKLDAKTNTEALGRHADALWKAISLYAEAHRDTLLPKDRKSVAIAAGIIGWRLGKPRLVVEDEDELIEYLDAIERTEFLRLKTELDKPALLGEPEAVSALPGVSIAQAEELFFKPLDLDDERVKKLPAAAKAAA